MKKLYKLEIIINKSSGLTKTLLFNEGEEKELRNEIKVLKRDGYDIMLWEFISCLDYLRGEQND